MTDDKEWQKFEEEVELRLQEGNITEDEIGTKWKKQLRALLKKYDVAPDKVIDLCKKLCFTDFIAEASEKLSKEIKISVKKYYSGLIFDLIDKNEGYDSEIRTKAWKTYKDIITSEKSVSEECCYQVFEYLKGDINKEDNAFLKKDISNTALYLMSRCSDNEKYRRWLFAIYEALANKQINNHKCYELVNRIFHNRFYCTDEAKIMFSICDEIIEQNPLLRKNAMKIMGEIYHNAKYRDVDESARVRYNNSLYRIATNYPTLRHQILCDILKREVKEPRYDKLPDKEWIHIGREDKPCDKKFKAVHADGVAPNIRGGLYAAPKAENGLSEWNNWFVEEGEQDCRSGNIYYLEPKEGAKCLVAYSEKDIKPYLVALYGRERPTIDAKALAKDYDCVYMGISEGKFGEHFWTNFNVSSLIFLKPNTFNAYTEEEWNKHKALRQKLNEVRKSANIQETEGISEKTTTISPANPHNPQNNTGFEGR